MNHNDCQLYAIDANPDHAHFLACLSGRQVSHSSKLSEENLATIVGESSQRFISQNKLWDNQFGWQESAAVFSVSGSDVDRVCKYILNQPEHHRKVSFAEEYEEFVKFYQKTLHPFEKR